jgi:hypothetical protein
MRGKGLRIGFFAVTLISALLLPLGTAAQVEEVRVRIDGMV